MKLTIVKVSYGKTFNLGNFQSERFDLQAEVEIEGDGVEEAYQDEAVRDVVRTLRRQVHVAQAFSEPVNFTEDPGDIPF
jgi:hypothetical protein